MAWYAALRLESGNLSIVNVSECIVEWPTWVTSQRLSEFELHARAILGLPVDTSLRRPGASAVIYGGLEATAIAFDGIDAALQVPESDLRLFGKPESFVKRRMGVAVANADTTDEARTRAKLAASRVITKLSDQP